MPSAEPATCSRDGVHLHIVHRDICPSNIMISGSGEVKLADFGIAKASTHKSVFYRVKGKVGYMSPEQAYGQPLDHRSDLYSLAVCLHEMLSGERLFVADLKSFNDLVQLGVDAYKANKLAEADAYFTDAMLLDEEIDGLEVVLERGAHRDRGGLWRAVHC